MAKFGISVHSGVRPVTTIGPRGGERRQFQVFIDRDDHENWTPQGGGRDVIYGKTFDRQWEAAQQARHDAECCRAAEAVAGFLRGKSTRVYYG